MSTKKYTNLIVTGSMAYDEIMDFPSHFSKYLQPDKLHQINVSFVVDRLEKQLGGTGTNIAYNAAIVLPKQKPSKVKLLSSVGKDGKDFISFLQKKGVSVEGVLVDKSLYTATGKVITDLDDNQIWGFYYGACQTAKEISYDQYATNQDVAIISANHPDAFLHFLNEVIRTKTDYMFDPGMAMTWITDEDLTEGVYNSRWLVGNDYEISGILKRLNKTIDDLTQKGVDVITTLGEKGVQYNANDTTIFVPSFSPKEVKDPTGAGDAWRGGFLGAILQQKDIKECLIIGNALASFAVEYYGTVNHKPTEKAINSRFEKIIKNL